MASPRTTKIKEFCKVVPNDAPSQFYLPLTFFDMIWLRLDPTSRLFFYEFPKPNIDFSDIFLPKLKKSLSLTLQHYLPVAGHLKWPQDSNSPIIQYVAGDGVSLTVAETQSDFHFLSGNDFRDTAELLALLPDFSTSETQTPVMTLQITLFPNTGFSIGYVAHHGVMDGKSVALFMHSWAYICKNGDDSVLPLELTPSFDRSLVEQQYELERIYPKSFVQQPIDPNDKSLTVADMSFPPDVMLGTFRLLRKDIDALKKSLFAQREKINKSSGNTPISTLTVSSAYVWLCLIKAKKIASGKTFVGINVDARARLEPPVSSTYFGNCVVGCAGGGDAEDLVAEDGFATAVEGVSEALDLLKEGLLKLAEKLNEIIASISRDELRDIPIGFPIAGSPRFELYKVDFGWGKPRKVEMVSIAKTGAFYVSDDRDGNGGIEIGVGLKKHEAEVFNSVLVSGLEAC